MFRLLIKADRSCPVTEAITAENFKRPGHQTHFTSDSADDSTIVERAVKSRHGVGTRA